MLFGLGLVGWGWLVAGWVGKFGVGGLGLVGRGLCGRVEGWWVGVGRSWFALEGRYVEVWSW